MIAKCKVCHHEWQQVEGKIYDCSWCGNPGKKLANDYLETKWLANIMRKIRERESNV